MMDFFFRRKDERRKNCRNVLGVRNIFCDGEEELRREIYGERKIVFLAKMKIGEEKGGKYLAKEIR